MPELDHQTNPRDRALWEHIGRRMQQRRTQLGLDTDYLAEQLSITKLAYEDYEAGIRQTPALLLGDVAKIFDLPVTWFFQDLSTGEAPQERDNGRAVFSVATDEERVETLTDYFRNLDLDAQQHVLAIARTLYRTSKGLDPD